MMEKAYLNELKFVEAVRANEELAEADGLDDIVAP